MTQQFKVLKYNNKAHREDEMGVPDTVPWGFVEPMRDRCLRTHSQTLERLNERGGLGPHELYAHAHGVDMMTVNYAVACAWLKKRHALTREDSRLLRMWAMSLFPTTTPTSRKNGEAMRDLAKRIDAIIDPRTSGRPDNFAELPADEQARIDADLGITNWNGEPTT